MKITPQILSIPPYLSTTWKNITSLHVKEEGKTFRLLVILQNRVQVEVPGLKKDDVDAIFEAHTKYAEAENSLSKIPFDSPYTFSLPLKADGQTIDPLMQHSPEQADLDPLPPDVLEKIAAVTKAFGLEELISSSKAEPGCNCMYCQIVRALKGESEAEEEVAEADLRFRNWDVEQRGEKLYRVTNPLDKNEYYDVFLGEPLGCTCAEKNCEHIRAVLNT